MRQRLIYGLVVLVLAVNLAIGARVYLNSAEAAEKDSAYPSLELFSYVMEKVRKDYVDGQKLTYQDLVYGALKGMVGTLDPHSEFMEPDQYKELQNDTQGSFGGLGIVVSMKDNFVTVIAPMDDSPGFRAGILSGDRIVKIDGKSTERMSLPDAVKNLRGEPGTEVNVTILRPSSGVVKDYKLSRAVINIDMAKDINGKKEFQLGEDKIGYVRLTQFGEKTSEELEAALKKLKAQGMQAMILDLRWNPGGLLDQAVAVCEKFLPRGELVVTTEGRNPGQDSVRKAGGRGDELHNMPMVVLVNLGSASASEIVAGCLQDLKRAYVLGEKTFGKGSVQSILPLQDGSALRLTTAKYYTPSHKVIHEQGITPNSIVTITDDEERDMLLKRAPGGIESLEEKDRERVQNARDPQLERAMDLLKGIMLFTQRAPTNEPRTEERENGGEIAVEVQVSTCSPNRWLLMDKLEFEPQPEFPRTPKLIMTLLAFETSCDETSAAVVKDGEVLSSVVSSQIQLHAEYGGVVPELAAREHLRNLIPVTRSALREARVETEQLNAIAATQGPGLPSALMVGFKAAQAMAFALQKPFLGIHHHEAHLYSPWIQGQPLKAGFDDFEPNVSLIVSGGHTMLVHVEAELKHRLLGSTMDDAAGECFDKAGKLIGLAYPAGPEIDRLAEQGNPKAFAFPRPLLNDPNDDFSFSGLKTSVRYFLRDHPQLLEDRQRICDLCASVQAAIVEVLVTKTIRAATRLGVSCVTASGGVTCNRVLRSELAAACQRAGLTLRLAAKKLCTDNAAMIGILAERKFRAGIMADSLDEEIAPGLALT